jgi:hypothetical protein
MNYKSSVLPEGINLLLDGVRIRRLEKGRIGVLARLV